jgi:hypothetical protein
MPASIKPLTVYLDQNSSDEFAVVRDYYTRKNDGQPVTDSQIGKNLIREKNIDILNRRTKSLTLERVYEEVASMRAELAQMLALLKEITTNV